MVCIVFSERRGPELGTPFEEQRGLSVSDLT